MRKILFVILFSFLIIFQNNCITKKDNVLILPFNNEGGLEIDYLSEIITDSIFSFFKLVPGYSAVHPDNLKQYMDDNYYKTSDLTNRNNLFKIAKSFKAKIILKGSYHEKDGFLIIDFEVINVSQKQIIYRSSKFEKGDAFVFNTIDIIAASMIEDFTGIKLIFGRVIVKTDLECFLYIDGEYYGKTPVRRELLTGKHEILLVYKDEDEYHTIYKKIINIENNKQINIDVNVFVNFDIDAEKKCDLYIDNKKIGITPYKGKLLTGNKYKLLVKYFDENKKKEIIIENKEISTENNEDLIMFLHITGSIKIISDENFLYCSIDKSPLEQIPFSFLDLPMGMYKIKAFMIDNKWKKKYLLYNKNYLLEPKEEKIIDISDIEYKKKYGLCFIPGASQFYNKEYAKGGVFLSLFLTSLTITALTPLITYSYREFDYLRKVNAWNENGSASGYSIEEIRQSYLNLTYIFYGFLVGGSVVTLFIWIYALIDGIVNMNRLDKLINPKIKNSNVRVKFVLNFDN